MSEGQHHMHEWHETPSTGVPSATAYICEGCGIITNRAGLERLEALEALARSVADLDGTHDRIRFTMLPDSVRRCLVCPGEGPTAQPVQHTDWCPVRRARVLVG